MFSHPQSTLLSFGLIAMLLGVSACGSQPINEPTSSSSPQPVTESADPQSPAPQLESEENSESPTSGLNSEREPLESQANSEPTKLPRRDTTNSAEPNESSAVSVTPKKVKIFFPKNPEGAKNLTDVEAVWRTTESQGIAQFAINELIAGPTSREKSRGLVDPIEFRGTSNCGRDFKLSVSQAGVANLQFCKQVVSGGIGDDARTKSAINATLKQFSTIQSVVILDKNGDCLADQSGENFCLNQVKNSVQLTGQSKLAINGIGPVDIGMTVEQASRAAGVRVVPVAANPNRVCDYYKPQSRVNGIKFMVTNGRIAAVELESSNVTTVRGAKIGDSETCIQSLYSQQLRVTPLPNSSKGHVLTFVPKSERDKNLRLRFTTDGQRVIGIFAGKLPEVEAIEGCLDFRPG